jgi:archaellum component FlaC
MTDHAAKMLANIIVKCGGFEKRLEELEEKIKDLNANVETFLKLVKRFT